MKSKRFWQAGALILAAVLLGGACLFFPSGRKQEVKRFTAFMAVPGENHVEDTRIKEEISRRTGASAQVEFLGGQTPEEKIEAMIQTGNYPDFINGADASSLLIGAGALIPLEDYLEDYPALYQYLTPRQW